MQTNLLGKTVCINDCGEQGEIVAVFQDRADLYIAAKSKNGSIIVKLAGQFYVIENRNHLVYLTWLPDHKIRAIKVVRELMHLELLPAKTLVDNSCGEVEVLKGVTFKEAMSAKEIIESNGLKCTIRERNDGNEDKAGTN